MRKIKNFLIALLLTIGFIACDQQDNVEPELTFEEKMESLLSGFREISLNPSSDSKERLILLGQNTFESFQLTEDSIPKTEQEDDEIEEENDVFLAEIDGVLYALSFDGECAWAVPIVSGVAPIWVDCDY